MDLGPFQVDFDDLGEECPEFTYSLNFQRFTNEEGEESTPSNPVTSLIYVDATNLYFKAD